LVGVACGLASRHASGAGILQLPSVILTDAHASAKLTGLCDRILRN
jgi:hypothetical protein